MELFNAARITHVHKDEDHLAIVFACGRTMVFTGEQTHPVIPEFIILEPEHLKDYDC